MNNDQWLQNLKAGDKVCIRRQYTSAYDVYTVERVTPAQIVLPRGSKYRKSDGYSIGYSGYMNGGHYLSEATPERLQGIADAAERNKLLKWARDTAFTLPQLRAMKAVVEMPEKLNGNGAA